MSERESESESEMLCAAASRRRYSHCEETGGQFSPLAQNHNNVTDIA